MCSVNLNNVKSIISEERRMYVPKHYFLMKWSHQKRYLIWKTLQCFRLAQYWKSVLLEKDQRVLRRLVAKFAYRYYFRQRNIYSEKSGVEIAIHSILGNRINIWHGGVVINGHIGDDCVFHGNNIIGNKGRDNMKTPVLGNGVDVGVGANVIGEVVIADGCVIGANAVVNKSFNEAGSLIVGVPAYVKGK